MVIICSRCGAEVGNILDHYDEHHGMPVAKVRDYRVFWDEEHEKKPSTHGSLGMYSYHGCRCDKCRASVAAAARVSYHRRKVERHSEICDT